MMLKDLNYELVAEGIENELLLKKIRQSGFKYAQGFLFGHPIRDHSRIQKFINEAAQLVG
jgi:EAL domain-containing protein (putative c-di-GMP-specific phosphodiesterase class I)